jgi:hypothetical protein
MLSRLVNEAIALILTLNYDNEPRSEGKDSRRNVKIIVANRVSPFDGLILRKVCQNANCKVVRIEQRLRLVCVCNEVNLGQYPKGRIVVERVQVELSRFFSESRRVAGCVRSGHSDFRYDRV